MRSFFLQFGPHFRMEVDTFGIYVVAGAREFFWQAGLGVRNFALCTLQDRDLSMVQM